MDSYFTRATEFRTGWNEIYLSFTTLKPGIFIFEQDDVWLTQCAPSSTIMHTNYAHFINPPDLNCLHRVCPKLVDTRAFSVWRAESCTVTSQRQKLWNNIP